MSENGWNEYSKLVLHELERLNECRNKDLKNFQEFRDCVKRSFEQIKVDIAVLKVKAGIWGFAGASIAVFLWIAVELFLHFKYGKTPSPPPIIK